MYVGDVDGNKKILILIRPVIQLMKVYLGKLFLS